MVIELRGKTEQRVSAMVAYLKENAPRPCNYEELISCCSGSHDMVLYVMATLCEIGVAEKVHLSVEGFQRPLIHYRWHAGGRAQALGA